VTPYRKMRLSKTDYLAGLQCSKHLWLRMNDPESEELEPDQATQALFDQGNKVGALARSYVSGGRLIDFPYYALDERVSATKRALEEGVEIVYEAGFIADGVFVSVDILSRSGDGFVVTEVKSSSKVKAEHLEELALQAHVLERNGIQIVKLEVMHLNSECAFPDLSDLFTRTNVTEEVIDLRAEVEGKIKANGMVLAGGLPTVKIGPQCSSPRACAFMNRCWEDVPSHHVTSLHGMGAPKAFRLVEKGYSTIYDLSVEHSLGAIATRQRRAVIEDRMIVEEGLGEGLRQFVEPVGFLDFETVAPAIPVWDGCHPYDAVPVQFSFSLQEANGSLTHSEWMAEGGHDPREAIANELVKACLRAKTIGVYNAQFERKCLQRLASAVPRLADELSSIEKRLVDLLPMVRDNVYHPQFHGGFGLKCVFPVLTGETAYETLEVADGKAASWLLQTLLLEPNRFTLEDRLRLREALLAYCRTDTESLAKLLSSLRQMSVGNEHLHCAQGFRTAS
jgi:predicted RecB family nuclease